MSIGIVFFTELTTFWILKMSKYELIYKYVTNTTFEFSLGISTVILIVLFNKFRK